MQNNSPNSSQQIMPSVGKGKRDITIAKGLAILLVVVGHITAGVVPDGNEWWSVWLDIKNLFHMPFFMAISGYLYFRPGRVEGLWDNYKDYVVKQARRLIVPFFLIGVLVIFGKLIASSIMYVDNVPSNFLGGFASLVWDTGNSPAKSVWYIFVLFFYISICPIIYRFCPKPLWICAAIGCGLYALPLIEFFYLNRFTTYFLFFVAGGVFRNFEKRYIYSIDKYSYLFVLLFLGSYVFYFFDTFSYQGLKLIIGLISIPAIHTLCRIIDAKAKEPVIAVLLYLGSNTLIIYMLNTIAIGVTKGIIFKITTWDGMNFFFVAPILILSGVFSPLIIRYLWRRVRKLFVWF